MASPLNQNMCSDIVSERGDKNVQAGGYRNANKTKQKQRIRPR